MNIRLIKCSFVRSCSDHKNPRTYIVLLFPFWSLKYYFINKTTTLSSLRKAWGLTCALNTELGYCCHWGTVSGMREWAGLLLLNRDGHHVTHWKKHRVGAKDEDSGAGAYRMSGHRHRLLSFSRTVSTSLSSAAKRRLCLSYSPKRSTDKIHKLPETWPASEC